MENQSRFAAGRREFLGAAAAALFAGITISILGCGDESTAPTLQPGDMAGQISDNHGHRAVVRKAMIDAGGAVTLDIQGTAGHNHTVSLTADDMAELKKGGMVTKDSSVTNSHSHSVMFM